MEALIIAMWDDADIHGVVWLRNNAGVIADALDQKIEGMRILNRVYEVACDERDELKREIEQLKTCLVCDIKYKDGHSPPCDGCDKDAKYER